MPDVRPEALKYIARGIYVLPLYGIDPVTGLCQCPNGATPCPSAGKHPLSYLAYNGSNDATLDPARVAEWPDDCNLGIKPTHTLVCIDFDEANVVGQILDLIVNDGEGSYCAAKTRRGVHVWVQATEPLEKTVVLFNEKRLKLADVKATGFLVAPPSAIVGIDGGVYQWLDGNLADAPPPSVKGTAVDYAERLLARPSIGIKLSKDQKGAAWSAPTHDLPNFPGGTLPSDALTDLIPDALDPTNPHVFDEADLRQIDSGTMATDNRSDTLYKYGCEIWRAADRRGLTLDTLRVAGAVKQLDARSYRKYADSRGPAEVDRACWDLAADARIRVTEDAEEEAAKQARAQKREEKRAGSNPTPSDTATEPPPGTSSPPPGGRSHYFWDAVAGSFWYTPPKGVRSGKVLICNFEPRLLETLRVWRDDGEADLYWKVLFGDVELLLGPSEIGDDRAFRKTVGVGLGERPHFLVHSWTHLSLGMRQHAANAPEREAFAMTGWLPGRVEFLLPGGSVTATGVGAAEYEDSTAPATFLRLGVQERPETSVALVALLQCAPPTIVTALLAQTLGASLLSVAGKDWPRTVLHQWGHTGSFKTTLNRLFASVFGATSDTYPMTSWVSTLTGLEQASHRARDLPAVFDDFKISTLNRQGQQDIIRFLQNNADGTGKSRSTRDLRERKVLASRGLILSSGEDPWSGQESIAARTVEVEAIEGPLDWQDPLATARDLPMDGIGFSWLRWCCQQGLETLHNELHWLKVEEQERTDETLHRRTAVSVAGLRAYSRLIQRWVAETFPEHVTLVADVFDQGWKEQGEEIQQQAVQAAAMAPFPDLVGILREQILARRANLHPRLGQDNFYLPLSQGADPVGYHDEEFVYLTRGLTYTWFERLCHQTGRQVPYTWRAVNSGGKAMGAVPNVQIRVSNEVNPLRALRVPRNLFVDDDLPDPNDPNHINALIKSVGINPDPPDDDDDDLFRPRSGNK